MTENVLYLQAKQRIAETPSLRAWEDVLLTDWHDGGEVWRMVAEGDTDTIFSWLRESGYDPDCEGGYRP